MTHAELISLYNSGKKLKYLFFWGHQPSKTGEVTSSCFSQWYDAGFTVEGIYYATAEHWMMAEKARLFGDEEACQKILAAPSPGHAKALGREVRGFDQSLWEAKRFDIVVAGNTHKFQQHNALGDFLQRTGNRVLVEASPVDSIWGIGLAADSEFAAKPPKWRGKNLLGFALMEVRRKF